MRDIIKSRKNHVIFGINIEKVGKIWIKDYWFYENLDIRVHMYICTFKNTHTLWRVIIGLSTDLARYGWHPALLTDFIFPWVSFYLGKVIIREYVRALYVSFLLTDCPFPASDERISLLSFINSRDWTVSHY